MIQVEARNEKKKKKKINALFGSSKYRSNSSYRSSFLKYIKAFFKKKSKKSMLGAIGGMSLITFVTSWNRSLSRIIFMSNIHANWKIMSNTKLSMDFSLLLSAKLFRKWGRLLLLFAKLFWKWEIEGVYEFMIQQFNFRMESTFI
jgi:hypothetical protein